MSLGNLWRRKLRTILTIWGMSVGVGAMVLLISFAAGLQKQNEKEILSSGTLTQLTVSKEQSSGFRGGNGSSADVKTFDANDIEKIRKFPHVLAAYPQVFLPPAKVALKDKKYDAFFQPTPLEAITDSKKSSLIKGSWWAKNSDLAAVISQSTLDRWKVPAADVVGQKVKVVTQTFSPSGSQDGRSYGLTITGITKSGSGFSDFSGDALAENLAEQMAAETPVTFGDTVKAGTYQAVTVYVDSKDTVDAVRKSVTNAGWFASGLTELLKTINQGFLIMKIVLGIIGGIALFVALIGITNSMLMAVMERTREIGILSAIGASRRTISGLFLSESGWLGALGAVLGLLGAFLIGKGIVTGVNTYLKISGKADNGLSAIQFYIGWPLAVGTLVGAILITLLAGWAPARRAAKQDPVKSLRHE